jgi:serine/threonine-protein kinase
MLTGQRLFDGGALIAMQKIVEGERVAPSRISPDVPRALDEIVLRALAVDPAARFTSADAMASALEHASAGAGLVPSRLGLARWLRVHLAAPVR